MTSRVLIVGEQPTRLASHEPALKGRNSRRLVELMDLRDDLHLRELFDIENLFARPQVNGWDERAARKSASALASRGHPILVLCGKRVQDAFGVRPGPEPRIAICDGITRRPLAVCIPQLRNGARAWREDHVVASAKRLLVAARQVAEGDEPFCFTCGEFPVDDPSESAPEGSTIFECGHVRVRTC